MVTFRGRDPKVFSEPARTSGPAIRGGIYGITSMDFGIGHVESAKHMVAGGVGNIQYRPKEYTDFDTMRDEALELKRICRDGGVTFIVNDDLRLAVAVDADGIHLGQKDISLAEARKRYPEWLKDRIIGISASTVEEALEAQEGHAGYIGVGPIFPTKTKGREQAIGLEEFWRIVGELRHRNRETLVVSIGGLKRVHLPEMKMGVHGVAVRSEVLDTLNPSAAARQWVREWERC